MPPRSRRTDKPLQRGLMRFWWRFILIALIAYVGYTIWLGGAYRDVEPFVAGQCIAVTAPAGPEDMAILPGGHAAIVSSQDRRDRMVQGGLFLYDMTSRPGRFTPIALPPNLPFHPHGMSLFTAPDGQIFLQVINHRNTDRHTVEIFLLQLAADGMPTVRHRGSVSSDLFVHPNGIAAVGPEAFYLTNDRGSGPGWVHMVENLLQLSRSTVVYHDGRFVRVVAEDIAFANGVELSADGGTLLTASTLWRMLLTYARDPSSGMLLRTGSLPLPFGPDNIRRDANGDLWVAGHPNAFAFIGHAMNAEKESPGKVLRISRDNRGATRIQEVFADPGTLISGTSVAVHHQGRLLVGAVFQSSLLDCQLDPNQFRDID